MSVIVVQLVMNVSVSAFLLKENVRKENIRYKAKLPANSVLPVISLSK